MEILLEQGLIVDGRVADYGWGPTGGGGGRTEELLLQDTCLIKVAERGTPRWLTYCLGTGRREMCKARMDVRPHSVHEKRGIRKSQIM